MTLTTADVLNKPPGDRAAGLSLARWKWKVLDLVDGSRSIAAIAQAASVEPSAVVAFAQECLAEGRLEVEAVSYADYARQPGFAPAPRAVPSLAPAPAPPAAAAASGSSPKVASLQERVAALKARALSAMQESADRVQPEAVEFSLAAAPKRETSANGDAVEFSL